MELTHDFTVPADVDTTWATFMDLERVGSCFPGAQVTSVTSEGFAGTVKVKLGPIALQYAGSGSFLERDDDRKRAVIEAKGKDKRGNGTAGATVRIQLAPSGAGTRVDVVTELAITGKPAQFGRGVMQDVSDKLLQQFVSCIAAQLSPAPGFRGHPEIPDEATLSFPAVSGETDASSAGPEPVAGAEPGAGAGAAPSTSVRPAASAAPSEPEALDLGSTVLPVLLRTYAPYAAAGIVGLVIGYLLGRR